ncbi:hypothetical protein D3C73_1412310 [compost metagenome]
MTQALADSDPDLVAMAIQGIELTDPTVHKSTEKLIASLAEKSTASIIRASAIAKLAGLKSKKYESLVLNGLKDQSYMVIASTLMAIKANYPAQLQQALKRVDADAAEYLKAHIANLSKS